MRCIDADALINRIVFHTDWSADEKEAFEDEINVEPTIEPERKMGKWIEFPNHMAYKCSECGRIIQTTDGRRNVSKHYPFCHCGADMREEGEQDA